MLPTPVIRQAPDGYILIRSKGSFGFTDIPKGSPYAIVTTVYTWYPNDCA